MSVYPMYTGSNGVSSLLVLAIWTPRILSALLMRCASPAEGKGLAISDNFGRC